MIPTMYLKTDHTDTARRAYAACCGLALWCLLSQQAVLLALWCLLSQQAVFSYYVLVGLE